MPTMPKMTAAVLLAVVAWFVSGMVISLLPEGTRVGMMAIVNAGIGFLMGWIIVGSRAGNGIVASIGIGLTAVVMTTFWSIGYWSFHDMIEKSLDKRYRGPMHALTDMVDTGIEYGALLINAEVMATMGLGALVVAIVPELVAKVWR